MDSIPIVVSTVLLLLLVPSVAYIFVSTPTKQDFTDHIKSDEENMREIRGSIDRLGSKIDNAMYAIMAGKKGGIQ